MGSDEGRALKSGQRSRRTGRASLHWTCVACGSENRLGVSGGRGKSPGRRLLTPSSPGAGGPIETACPHCRTRHILASEPGDLMRIAPREEVGRRSGIHPRQVGLGILLLAGGVTALYAAVQTPEHAANWVILAILAVTAVLALPRVSPGAGAFLATEEGLEVRGPDGGRRALIPWEKIRAAEYRLLMGRRMALWLAIEASDGSVPAAPLLAETGVALFTRSRAMPQFLLALAGMLEGRAAFLLPILTVDPQEAGRASQGAAALALRSEFASRLIAGALSEEDLPRSLARPE